MVDSRNHGGRLAPEDGASAGPKYSIVIPARNGGAFLPACLETILEQDYDDYEVVVSDDHSSDDSWSLLEAMDHPRLRLVRPPEGLSMAEHWEWALAQARGRWMVFVGQDDGLQSYFFRLADLLTARAERSGLRSIMSERAYYFWSGCEFLYGSAWLDFKATPVVETRDFRVEAVKVLVGAKEYFELPQMYTTSLFHRDLVREAKSLQEGLLFTAHPQDANLAAIACSLERGYLRSSLPLGWVGTSARSAGMAVSATSVKAPDGSARQDLESLNQEYQGRIGRSAFAYHPLAGPFAFGSMILYFWQALCQTSRLRKPWVTELLLSRPFRGVLLGLVRSEGRHARHGVRRDADMFREILVRNDCSRALVAIAFVVAEVARGCLAATALVRKGARRLRRAFGPGRLVVYTTLDQEPRSDLPSVSRRIAGEILRRGWLDPDSRRWRA
jgi:hypothetical protein